MKLFTEHINSPEEWENIFQSTDAFKQLLEYIFEKEKLPAEKIETLTPGTNAVFKVGGYIVKIFAPAESRIDYQGVLQTECLATKQANKLNIPSPKVIASGYVEDKYRFDYMITNYINGEDLGEAAETMTDAEKITVGRKLRDMTDKMNVPCEPFNDLDIINDTIRNSFWDNYTEQLKKERLAYLKSHKYGENVFVHGDLCPNNILVTPQGELYIIDFADAVLAPKVYEHALAALESDLDPMILRGYFEDYAADEFIEMCISGLLISNYDEEYVDKRIGKASEFQCLEDLRTGVIRYMDTFR
jgi:Ser/Thr protein kinase RdoA (MazF antagonist)